MIATEVALETATPVTVRSLLHVGCGAADIGTGMLLLARPRPQPGIVPTTPSTR